MEQNESNKEVSNSSCGDSESPKNVPLACRGTQMSLNGEILKKLDGYGLLVKVDYKERQFAGVLLEAFDSWGPIYPPGTFPQDDKKSEQLKTKEGGMKQTQRKQTFSPSKNPLTCVSESNIVKNKLRYGRITSSSPCPRSPILHNSGNSTFSSSGSDSNSVSVHASDLKITSLKDGKCLDKTFILASESSTLPSKKTDDCHSPPKKIKNCKSRKNIEMKASSSKRTLIKYGSSTFICSYSPRLDNYGNSLSSSSGNDVNSVSVSDSALKITSDEKCLDETFIPAHESSTLPSKKTDGYHSPSQKIKNCKTRKKFETKESGTKRTQTKSGSSTSICSNSPRLDNSGNSVFNSSVNDVNSVSVSDSDLKITSDEKCLDETFIPAPESSTLLSKKTDDYQSPSQKIKNCESRKTFETKVSGTKRTRKKYQRFTSSIFPSCYVHSCNTVDGRLRSDSDKLATSYSSCPSSSRLDNSENIEFRSSGSDMNSASVSDSDLKLTSLKYEKCLDETFVPASESSTVPSKKTDDCHSPDQKIKNCKSRNNLELDKDSMPRIISRYDIEETDETLKENWNPVMPVESIENSDGMPNLQPIEPHFPRLRKVSSTYSDISKSTVEGSTSF